jgi:hypothetical protein
MYHSWQMMITFFGHVMITLLRSWKQVVWEKYLYLYHEVIGSDLAHTSYVMTKVFKRTKSWK